MSFMMGISDGLVGWLYGTREAFVKFLVTETDDFIVTENGDYIIIM